MALQGCKLLNYSSFSIFSVFVFLRHIKFSMDESVKSLCDQESRQTEVSAQRERSPLPGQVEAVRQSSSQNCPPVFISDTLLSIFNKAAAGVTSGESALWEGEMKERCGGEGRGREASNRFLSLSPMNAAQVREATSAEELYIADKWWGFSSSILLLSVEARTPQGKSAVAAGRQVIRDQIYEESNVWWACSWVWNSTWSLL